jgi:hypothetical protein
METKMKSLFIVICILAIAVTSVHAQSDLESLADQANAAYTNRDFVTAESLYQTIIRAGGHDAAIYFNLASLYYQNGDLGRAVLNFRRVQQFWPRDVEAADGLARARSMRIDLQGDETGFAEGLTTLTLGVLTLNELSVIVGLLWTLWFGLLAGAILKSEWRSPLRIPIAAVASCLFIGLIVLGARLYITTRAPSAIVIEQVVTAKSGPGDDYLELYKLHAAAELRVWDAIAGWVQFALPDGRLGWIPAESVEMVETTM